MSSSYFNSNIWYQISNAALGGSVSLDVLNADGASLDGNVDMTLSKFLSGQLWQILIANTTTNGYYIANQLSGAQNKLDISKNSEQDYIPFLKPFNVTYNQTWNIYRTGTITKFGNATYIFEPTYFHGGQALTAGENSTVLPFLSSTGCPRQQWVVTAVSRIDDPAFSPTAILSTSFSVQKTAAPTSNKDHLTTTTAWITTTPSLRATAESQNSPLMPNAELAAVIVAPITLFVALIILITILVIWRRKTKMRGRCFRNEQIGRPLMRESNSQLEFPRPPFATAPSSNYAQSVASTSEFSPIQQPEFDALLPRPMSRQPSWHRGRNEQPFFGSSALGNREESEEVISPLEPVRLPSVHVSPFDPSLLPSPRSTPSVRTEPSPISTLPSLRENDEGQMAGLAVQPASSRPLSLISHWQV